MTDRNTKVAPKLLSGGNPRILEGEGDGPVHKAVKWNQPFHGVEGDDR